MVRVWSVLAAFIVGFFGGPWAAEIFGRTANAERGFALVLAFVGVNVLAGLGTFALKWAKDPQAAVAWVFSLWRGGGGGTGGGAA